jgi:hypothetical protein
MGIKTKRAPTLAKWLFDRIVRSEEKSTVVGDIEEFFCELGEERGIFRAKLWFWAQILVSLPVFIKKFDLLEGCHVQEYHKDHIPEYFET